MKTILIIEINHPIFGDSCQVGIECDCNYIPPNYENGYLENSGGFEINSIKVLEINDKYYSQNIMESMSTFILNNYEEQLSDLYAKNYRDY